jgi:signal transduction histidine kinase
VEIAVEDDGPGVEEAHIPRLFTAFDRLGQQKRGKIEGTGLGLALSKSLVESMGGTIWYEAMENGSRFCFRLPDAAASDDQSAAVQGAK